MTIPMYSKGDVVVIRFPFSSLTQSKIRPALVVTPEDYIHRFGELVVMQITSRHSDIRPQYAIHKWREAHLKAPSYVRYANLHHIHVQHVFAKIGELEREEYQAITEQLEQFVSLD